jgi:hypothetical protein
VARSSAVALLLLAACGSESTPALRCRLSPGEPFGEAPGSRFDAVAVDARGDAALAVWSSSEGLFVRQRILQYPSNVRARAPAPAIRIGEPCRGGVDVEHADDRVFIGCMRPGDDEEHAEAVLIQLETNLTPKGETPIGRAGRDGRGIDVEVAGKRTLVLYQEGVVGAHAVRLVIREGESVTEQVVSRPGHAASQPSLFVDEGASYATFTETDYDTPGKQASEILVARVGQPARVLEKVRVDDPAPHLGRDERGLVLTFRDLRDGEHRAELYALRLSDQLTPQGKPAKIGRANTEGAPVVHVCEGQRLGVLPREYGGERYIALHALGPALENLSQGHQFYANERDFVLAAAACFGRELFVLAGEQKTPADRGVQLMALRFGCD